MSLIHDESLDYVYSDLTRDDALAKLKALADEPRDQVEAHREADRILLSLINDPEITDAFDEISKWYA